MTRIGQLQDMGRAPGRWLPGTLILALGLVACGGSDSPEPREPDHALPTGRLMQSTLRGPITHTTGEGWRTRIEGGTVTIRPPEALSGPDTQYVSWRMREQLGTHDLRAWEGDRRSLLLPGGAKITMHGQAGEILRLSIYDGAESHELDVLTQTIMHSQVSVGVAQARDTSEADGETAHLASYPYYSGQAVPPGLLHFANLYVQQADSTGTPLRPQVAVRALGRLEATDLHVHERPVDSGAEADATCEATAQPRGRLVQLDTGALDYATASGKWNIRIDVHTITVTRSGLFTWQAWGDPHENLNGKHIKDWLGERRTLLLDDGTKITMHADGPHHVTHTTSIYDGAQSHQISNVGNTILHSCVNAQVASLRDADEADGETAYLAHLRSPASTLGYLHVENVYTGTINEDGESELKFEPVELGTTGEADINPNQVNDFYDDPRLGHT